MDADSVSEWKEREGEHYQAEYVPQSIYNCKSSVELGFTADADLISF
jgi:hypothetical protein